MSKAEALIKMAAKRNRSRDATERSNGFAAPGDSGLLDLLRTADSALSCGLEINDMDAVAEGTAMLREAIARLNRGEQQRKAASN